MNRIAVLGAGAWGTAIALSLHRRGDQQITLWSHSEDEARQIAAAGENVQFLPGFPLPADLKVTHETAAITEAEIVVSVIPSEFLRPTLTRLRGHLRNGQFVVSATKGVEDRTFLRMTQVISRGSGAGGTAAVRLARSPGRVLRSKWRKHSPRRSRLRSPIRRSHR